MIQISPAFSNMALLFWVAFLVAAVFAMPVYRSLLAMKSRQIVSEYVPEHAKKQGTPTMGGIIIVIGFLVACIFAAYRDFAHGPVLPATIILFAGFALIGLLDDYIVPKLFSGKRGLGWKQKLAMEIVIAAVGVSWLRHGSFTTGAFLSVFVILFFSNAFNFVDGMDGLAGTILVLLAGGLCALGILQMRPDVYQYLCVAMIGAVIPFLFLNAPPARLFMGDVGSLPIGAVLGLIVNELMRPGRMKMPPNSLASLGIMPAHPLQNWFQTAIPVAIISVVLIVELVPVPLQIASVKLLKKRLFLMTPIHHAFEKAGWPESRVVWFFGLTQFLLGSLALAVAVSYPVTVR